MSVVRIVALPAHRPPEIATLGRVEASQNVGPARGNVSGIRPSCRRIFSVTVPLGRLDHIKESIPFRFAAGWT